MTLHYDFPLITRLYDVLPAIKDESAFVVLDKGDYVVIDYVYQTEEVFPVVDPLSRDKYAAIRRECRGLIFDARTKELVSRPYHKFFNYGEREDTQRVDLSRKHRVLTKLDGSMIRPLRLNGGYRLATRKGITEVAMQAETFVAGRSQYKRLFERCDDRMVTPIFEWCAPNNRIVVEYSEPSLVLCAARETLSGRYLTYDELEALARDPYRSVPVVKHHGVTGSMDKFVKENRKREGIEGFVIRFDDGHMLKVKTDWYVAIHKTKDLLSSERAVVELWLNNQLDDLLATLDAADQEKIKGYVLNASSDIERTADLVRQTVGFWKKMGDRKHFATTAKLDPMIRSFAFSCWDDENLACNVIRSFVQKHSISNGQFQKAKATVLTSAQLA